jgi:uncharacterized membrane protein
MTYKEWAAVIELLSAAVIGVWLVYDAMNGGLGDGTVASVAMRLLWAIGTVIVFNILATIVITILVSIARREEFKDEAADERDRLIGALASRNGYAVVSIGAALGLVLLAFGADPVIAAYALFGAPMLGGLTDAVSRLVYYRIS